METERDIAAEPGQELLSVASAREMLLAGDAGSSSAEDAEPLVEDGSGVGVGGVAAFPADGISGFEAESASSSGTGSANLAANLAADAFATALPDSAPADRTLYEGTVGLGVDIVEIARMEAILARSAAFAQRVFSADERAYCDARANAAAHYAVRFAAKEAVVKALGTGFADGIGVRDIEVVRDKRGKPTVALSGRARELADEQGVRELSISLSYTHVEAVACAMALTESAVRATEKRRDPMEELSRQFKDLRGMLDEI